jgi:hypothetical protein
MPSEHMLIFISSILELLVLLFVAYEVIVGELRHRRAAMVSGPSQKPRATPIKPPRRMSILMGFFIAFISLAVWLVIYLTYSNGPNFLTLRRGEPDTGPLVWNFEQSARGAGYFLTMQKVSDQPEIRVISFGAKGKNNSDKPITKFNGYLRSEQTNVTIPIYLLAQEQDESKNLACFPHAWIPTSAEETYGIPAFADFEISSSEKPFIETGKDGIPLSKFLNDFVPFTVILEYDGTKYERRFTTEEVKRQIALLENISSPPNSPRIARKPNPKMAPPLPLQTLLPANPPKTPPGLASPIPSAGLPQIPEK